MRSASRRPPSLGGSLPQAARRGTQGPRAAGGNIALRRFLEPREGPAGRAGPGRSEAERESGVPERA
jgi:hypothetical protein